MINLGLADVLGMIGLFIFAIVLVYSLMLIFTGIACIFHQLGFKTPSIALHKRERWALLAFFLFCVAIQLCGGIR